MSESIPSQRATLKKDISKVGFFCLAFGAMIGVGWVTAMGPWLRTAGPIGASIGFAIGGLLMLFIGFCYAEVQLCYQYQVEKSHMHIKHLIVRNLLW
ncbi:MAG: hypothetical protein RIA63_01520 [Cyclobacteriaceae bacterium]